MSRRLGQHFLRDTRYVERILSAAALGPQDRVLEIGPGQGALTLPMAQRVARVVAYELDPRLAAKLPARPNLEVRQADILKLDWSRDLEGGAWKVVANLPYYITTPIIEKLLEGQDRLTAMWLMMQREVAERICSEARRQAGALTHFVQYACRAEYLFDVPPQAFSPPPQVDSAVVCLRVRGGEPRSPRPQRLFQLIRAAFAQRRKMLRRSLPIVPAPAFAAAGIDSTRRPETLTLDEFCALEEAWWAGEKAR